MRPQTAAACAVHYAHEEKKDLLAKASDDGKLPVLLLTDLAEQDTFWRFARCPRRPLSSSHCPGHPHARPEPLQLSSRSSLIPQAGIEVETIRRALREFPAPPREEDDEEADSSGTI
eukprot:scaffold126518_cov32-Tisochrysis_lutea.AAC.3